jgi:hypothetical protein
VSAQLFKALVAAQADLKPPKFDSSSTAFGGRPYRYASLASVVDAARTALGKHGIAVLQPVSAVDGRLVVHTMLAHTSGESWTSDPFAVPMASKMQDIGGQITYARRYSLSAALALAAEEDNDCDGEKAAEMPQEASAARKAAPSRPEAPTRQEAALAGKTKATLRVVGTVSKIYENEKSTKIMLESGEQLKAWNDATFLDLVSVGKTYEFRCEPSDNPKYPAPTARDAVEVAAPGMGGEEIPF